MCIRMLAFKSVRYILSDSGYTINQSGYTISKSRIFLGNPNFFRQDSQIDKIGY